MVLSLVKNVPTQIRAAYFVASNHCPPFFYVASKGSFNFEPIPLRGVLALKGDDQRNNFDGLLCCAFWVLAVGVYRALIREVIIRGKSNAFEKCRYEAP